MLLKLGLFHLGRLPILDPICNILFALRAIPPCAVLGRMLAGLAHDPAKRSASWMRSCVRTVRWTAPIRPERLAGGGLGHLKVNATNIAQMASASDVIFEALREAINSGDLAEGETLRQDQIARLFNVSRIPVREALTRLEEHGLVETQRYRGAVVTSLSPKEIAEIFEFRALLEPQVIQHSVARMSAETLDTAKAYCKAFATE